MPTPGLLYRLSDTEISDHELTELRQSIKGIELIYLNAANDEKHPAYSTFIFLGDIDGLNHESDLFSKDQASSTVNGAPNPNFSWHILRLVGSRAGPKAADHPTPGTVIVANGNTPRPDKVQDYHDWYDQEHGEKLTHVPGWQKCLRYELIAQLGSPEGVASFIGVNLYDQENGLGGPEWQKGVTEWTMRIRDNAAKPNVRRVWKIQKTL
jgi:hypothetical protein